MRGRTLPLGATVAALWLGVGFWRRAAYSPARSGSARFPLDDSWIHLHFARNLAEGAGFANPGVPVAGSTAPLWTLLLGGSSRWARRRLGQGPRHRGRAGTAWLAGRPGGLELDGATGLALVAGVLAALAGPLVWGALSGMEVSLAALLVTMGVLAHSRAGTPAVWAWPSWPADRARRECRVWLAGLLTARRAPRSTPASPRCSAPLVAVQPGHRRARRCPPPPRPRSRAAWSFPPGPGSRLATTFVRVEAVAVRSANGCDGSPRWNVLLPALAVVGLGAGWRRRGRVLALPAAVRRRLPLSGWRCSPRIAGRDSRRAAAPIHLLPVAIAVAVVAWPIARARGSPGRTGRAGSAGDSPRGVAGRAWPSRRGGLALPGAAVRYAWGVPEHRSDAGRLAGWLPPSAARGPARPNDVGAIAYVSRREVVDVMGLVTPAIRPVSPGRRARRARYLERACPRSTS